MKTIFYQSSGMPAGNCAKYIFFGKASKATVLYGVAALVCGLFLSVAPTRAQSVIPSDIPPHVVSIGNNLLVYGRALMIIPQGGKHVRQVAIISPPPLVVHRASLPRCTARRAQGPCSRSTTSRSMTLDIRRRWPSQPPMSKSACPRTTVICNYVVTGIKR